MNGDFGQDAAQASPPTEVVLLGTLHGGHSDNAKYSVDTLRVIIVMLEPSAILVELPPTIGGRPTVRSGHIPKQFAGNENTAASLAAQALGVPLVPYDREGRNEIYKVTRYFDREKQAYGRLEGWIEERAQEAPESLEVLIWRILYESIEKSQHHLICNTGPDIINSPAYDMVIMSKKCIQHRIWPKMLTASGEQELAGEFLFFRDEWEQRNQIMANNIVKIAEEYAQKRLVVLCGAEHRYFLRDSLGKTPGVTLKEFYEVLE